MEVMSLQEFTGTEHTDHQKATRQGIRETLSQGDTIIFFDSDVYIVEHSLGKQYSVTLGNTEMQFNEKLNAIRYLYQNWYLSECTDLFVWSNTLQAHGYSHTHTGGGCTALEHELPNDTCILLTDGDCSAPAYDAKQVLLGLIDADGNQIFSAEVHTYDLPAITNILVSWATDY